jgi:uncharacterized membrane protein YphA (DoxX/SURF4 family)
LTPVAAVRRLALEGGNDMTTISGSSFVRALIAAIVVLAVAIGVGMSIGNGLAFLGIALWIDVLVVAAAGVLLITRGRPIAGAGAIVVALSVLLAFFWLGDGSPLVWSVLFFVGVALIVRGTAEDTVRRGAWVLLLPRVGIGWAIFDNAQDHFRSNWLPAVAGTGYVQTATGAANRPAAYFLDPIYQGFLKGTVVPNIDVFAALTVCGEMTFGLLLAIGLCTPVAALGAMFLHFNYFNMKSFTNHGGYVDKVFFGMELFNLITCSGLVYGLDASLRRIVPPVVAETLMGVPVSEDEGLELRPAVRPI